MDERLDFAPWAFVDGEWQPAEKASRSAPVDLRVLTWNVYFGGHMFEERRDQLLAELDRRRPPVIVLQEVTTELLATLVEAPWVRSQYQVSDVDGTTLLDYGVFLLTRLPVRKLSLIDLPSEMARRLLIAELACGLTVATVHLESGSEGAPVRQAQLEIIQSALRGRDDLVLLGDMNFVPGSQENAAVDSTFLDVWPALHGDDPGYTVDTEINTMRAQLKSTPTRKRIDRVFLRSRRVCASAIRLIGTTPIDLDGTFVSDHFGLEVDLKVRD
jgi:endonuclease/exonuclease/phosphatase family metal-dependent hydrolase